MCLNLVSLIGFKFSESKIQSEYYSISHSTCYNAGHTKDATRKPLSGWNKGYYIPFITDKQWSLNDPNKHQHGAPH